MMETGRDQTVPPCWVDVACWVVAAEKNMIMEILQNAWSKKGLENFQGCGGAATSNGVATAMAAEAHAKT